MVTIAVELGFEPPIVPPRLDVGPVLMTVNIEPKYEFLKAEPVGEMRYRIRAIPLRALGVNWLDEVETNTGRYSGLPEDVPLVTHVVRRSGHSTYWLGVPQGIESKAFTVHWEGLERLGCRYDAPDKYYIAVDVPPTASAPQVEHLLAAGTAAHVWHIHEGQDEHPTVS